MKRVLRGPDGLFIAVLAAAAITLIAAAVIGGRHARAPVFAAAAGDGSTRLEGVAVAEGKPASSGGQPTTRTTEPSRRRAAAPASTVRSLPRRSTAGATRIGVFSDHFRIGIHAPLTFDGAPLNLAEDPVTGVKGYITYVNRHGGINGLKIKLYPEDDRYTTAGARQAADHLVREVKPFLIEGALGIDQIHKVALAAKGAGIPYVAGGGPEPEFRRITDMYQNVSSYDQYLSMVADFICKFGAAYVGGKSASDVRLGTTTLNSEFILPVERRFVAEVSRRRCVRTPVESRARGRIAKPTEQTSYSAQMIDLRTAYGNQGANLIVPLQDPVSTSRQVLEWTKSGYRPKWTIANFAHDSDTALTLFQGEWTGMRVMSGACYYHPSGGGRPYDPSRCAAMGEAHRQWVGLGHVDYDANAGGSVGGKSSYDYDEDSWTTDGGGGAAGYQLVYFWHGAMKAIGTDPTREKFVAALNAYDNYSNIVTGPITFAGSPNRMAGATKFALLEGQRNLKYRHVTEITPGLADHF